MRPIVYFDFIGFRNFTSIAQKYWHTPGKRHKRLVIIWFIENHVADNHYTLDVDVAFDMVTVRYGRPSGTTAMAAVAVLKNPDWAENYQHPAPIFLDPGRFFPNHEKLCDCRKTQIIKS